MRTSHKIMQSAIHENHFDFDYVDLCTLTTVFVYQEAHVSPSYAYITEHD